MPKHNAENERIKRTYFTHLKAARGLSEASIDAAAKAIHRFESSTGFRSFKKFHIEQAIAFRRRLDEAVSCAHREAAEQGDRLADARTSCGPSSCGSPSSRATEPHPVFGRRLFQPVGKGHAHRQGAAAAPGSHALSRSRASCVPCRPAPTSSGAIARLIAFTWLTGIRDGALASLKLKHVDLAEAA